MANNKISPEALAIENMFREQRAGADETVDILTERENTKDVYELAGEPGGVRIEHEEIEGVPALRIIPDLDEGDFTVIFLHGGAYCLMSAWTHHRLAGHMASSCRRQVIVPDYSLAPEHPFPKARDECTAVLLSVQLENPEVPVALIGESAGGGLALSSLLTIRDGGQKLPFAAILMAPWLDLTLESPSVRTAAEDDVILTEGLLRAKAALYAAGADLNDPLVSPLFGKFAGLPPLYVQSAGKDLLRDDSSRLENAYIAQGLSLRHDFYTDMLHSFQFYAGNMPEADRAIVKCADFLHENFAKQRTHSDFE